MSVRTRAGKIEVAVVGAGRWGRLHAQKWASIPGVRVAAIVDPQQPRAVDVARAHPHAAPYPSVDALPDTIDASSVAVEIGALAPVTAALLQRRIHVLAEKPLAGSVGEAKGLHLLARRRGVHLAVGFLERFNTALRSIGSTPGRVVCHRVGPAREDIDWLLDWLVHDLDLVRFLFGEPLHLTGLRHHPRGVGLSLRTASGRIARLYTGHAERRRRRLWADGETHDLIGPDGDPLRDQLCAFAALIRGGRRGLLAGPDAAIDALAIVEAARRVARAA